LGERHTCDASAGLSSAPTSAANWRYCCAAALRPPAHSRWPVLRTLALQQVDCVRRCGCESESTIEHTGRRRRGGVRRIEAGRGISSACLCALRADGERSRPVPACSALAYVRMCRMDGAGARGSAVAAWPTALHDQPARGSNLTNAPASPRLRLSGFAVCAVTAAPPIDGMVGHVPARAGADRSCTAPYRWYLRVPL
jgi:hypothetical protein